MQFIFNMRATCGFILLTMVFLVLITWQSPDAYALIDNISIEGNVNPLIYTDELYVIHVQPSTNNRDITLFMWSVDGKIASYQQGIPSNADHVNFFIKFFPPLYKVGEKYTIEVSGSGLIGRKTITINEDQRGL